MGSIREVLEECLEAWANLLKKEKGECLNPGEVDCKCTVCKINRILGEEEIGLMPEFVNTGTVPFQYTNKEIASNYPEVHEGIDLSKVYALYPKIICIEQWFAPYGQWTRIMDIDKVNYPISDPSLYYEYGIRWLIARCKISGGTAVQFRCKDKDGELCYPDFKISELLP